MPLFPSQQPSRAARRVPEPGAGATGLLRRYRPLETRASGSFGSVEICLDSRLQRRVAIKRIPLFAHGAHGADIMADALAEARTASMLPHPHIVSMIDFTYDAAYAYLVMEYVDGMSLEEFLAQVDGHSLTFDEAACIADALAQALAYAHENGALHLDIKPANVLIDRNGTVKLADFGMAKLTSAAGFGGARGGTIGYMSSEQLRGDRVDERSDVFSLACVLYESLCGTAPFRAADPLESLNLITRGVEAPSDLLPDLPASAEDALLAALSPEADGRTADVAAFGERFCSELGSVREGRRSLARIIAQLTSDDEEEREQAAAAEERGWDIDPEEGLLGSRWPAARRIFSGAVSGVSLAAICAATLGALGGIDPASVLAVSIACGAAAAAAPQIGSALAFTGLIMASVSAGNPLATVPAAVLVLAAASGWWLVWGRAPGQASCVLMAAWALGLSAQGACAPLPIAASLAALTLGGTASAGSLALGAVAARLSHAVAPGAGLGVGELAAALADPPFLVGVAACCLVSAVAARLVDRARAVREGARPPAWLLAACGLLLFLGCALPALAHPMEIASLTAAQVACAVAVGAASSILIWLYVYLFGYRKDRPECDRS